MNYYQFVQAVETKMKEVIDDNTSVSIYKAEKYNGVSRLGINISQKDNNISPTIYLEDFYASFLRGFSLDEIVEEVFEVYQEAYLPKPMSGIDVFNYDVAKNKIIYRLINFETNRQLLQNVPYIPYLDLAIIFYVMVEFEDYGTACMMVRNEHLEIWNVKLEDVYDCAKDNTWKLLPSELHSMEGLMQEYTDEKITVSNEGMYVLTNSFRNFGASAILYENCLEMIGEFLEDNFYILPSSVHEVIIVSENDAPGEGEELSKMVSEINRTQVATEEVLSNCAYYYDRVLRKTSIA